MFSHMDDRLCIEWVILLSPCYYEMCFSVDLPLLDPSMAMAKFQRLIL